MEQELYIDSHKLMYHPERVAEWKRKGDCCPIYIEISPTDKCNHNCIFCALDYLKRENRNIDKDVMVDALKNMAEYGVRSVMFAGEGESLLHKDIGLFTQKAKQYGLDVAITTNGVPLNKSKREQCLPNLSWIKFSIDSGTPENYTEIHRTSEKDFKKVIENIRESVNYRNKNNLKITIGTQILIVPQNIDQATKLAEIVRDIKVDYLVIKPYSQHPKSKNRLYISLSEYNSLEEKLYKFNSEDFKIIFRRATAERIEQGIIYPKCYGLPFSALIDVKGNIIPCNLFHGDPAYSYGNLYENSFKDIWGGNKRKEVLRKIEEAKISKCRRGCRMDAMNRYLERVLNPHPHDNFP